MITSGSIREATVSGIVHRYDSDFPALLHAFVGGAHYFAGGLAHRIICGFQLLDLRFAEQDFARDVQADHGERDLRVEDDAGCFGVHVEIEFRGGGDIAAGERAAHDGDLRNHRGEFGIAAQGESDVGERADGDDGDFAGTFADDAANDFGSGFADWLYFCSAEIHAAEAVGAVDVAGGDQASQQRMAGAGGDGDVGATSDFDETQRVGESEFERNVAADRGDGFDFQLGRAQG